MADTTLDGTVPRVWRGNPALEPFLVPVAELHEDPRNANTHPDRNLADIRASYREFGQQKPAVVDRMGVMRAGNGQLRVARELGWTHLAVVTSDLDGTRLTAYAIADNQSGPAGIVTPPPALDTAGREGADDAVQVA